MRYYLTNLTYLWNNTECLMDEVHCFKVTNLVTDNKIGERRASVRWLDHIIASVTHLNINAQITFLSLGYETSPQSRYQLPYHPRNWVVQLLHQWWLVWHVAPHTGTDMISIEALRYMISKITNVIKNIPNVIIWILHSSRSIKKTAPIDSLY